MMEEQWSEVANGNLLQRRFPMITKFFNWNWLFGNNLYIISTGSGSGACLTPIFRFQALAKSSTNILAARTRTRLQPSQPPRTRTRLQPPGTRTRRTSTSKTKVKLEIIALHDTLKEKNTEEVENM